MYMIRVRKGITAAKNYARNGGWSPDRFAEDCGGYPEDLAEKGLWFPDDTDYATKDPEKADKVYSGTVGYYTGRWFEEENKIYQYGRRFYIDSKKIS